MLDKSHTSAHMQAAQLTFPSRNLSKCAVEKPNFSTQFCSMQYMYIVTAAVDNNEILFLYFLPVLKRYEGGGRGGDGSSGEIEFNVYSLHDIFVTYLFDMACMFAQPKVYTDLPLPPPPFFSFYQLQHFTSSFLVVYNILYLSPDLVDP